MKTTTLKFDVMIGSRYQHRTVEVPLGLPIDYIDEQPVFNLPSEEEVYAIAEKQYPSLIGKKYHLEMVTHKPQWRNN